MTPIGAEEVTPDATPEPDAEKPKKKKTRIIRADAGEAKGDTASSSGKGKGKGKAGKATKGAATSGDTKAKMPKLTEHLERVKSASSNRNGSASSSGASRPRVEIEPSEPAPTANPNPFETTPPAADAAEAPQRKRGLLRGIGGGSAAATGGGLGAATAQAAELAATERQLVADPADAPADSGTAADGAFSSGLLARKAVEHNGPSFRTGLILTLILLALLALVAIWSVLFLPNSPVARFFGVGAPQDDRFAALAPGPDVSTEVPGFGSAAPEGAAAVVGEEPSFIDEAAADGIDVAVLEPDDPAQGSAGSGSAGDLTPDLTLAAAPIAPLPDEGGDEAENILPDIDAELDLPPLPELPQANLPSPEEAAEIYAQDGIWTRTPDRPDLQPFDLLDRIVTAGIDAPVSGLDAVALPPAGTNEVEVFRRFPNPPAFGTRFSLTPQGLVEPTPEGVLTPLGAFVVAGPPPQRAVPRPREITEDTPQIDVDSAILSLLRPTPRPNNLDEIRERQLLGGLTEAELGAVRPTARPLSPQETAARASLFPGDDAPLEGADADQSPSVGTALAVARSIVPPSRPTNIAQIVASADRRPVEQPTAVAAAAAAPQPNIPSNADVARAATERNAIRLRNVNLIGVTGTPSDRRALVRLSSGRFVRVGVGDRLDGGRVAAIGQSTLQYIRNGRTVTLDIPG